MIIEGIKEKTKHFYFLNFCNSGNFLLSYIFCWETVLLPRSRLVWTHCVSQADFKLTAVLSLSPKCRDYRCATTPSCDTVWFFVLFCFIFYLAACTVCCFLLGIIEFMTCCIHLVLILGHSVLILVKSAAHVLFYVLLFCNF